MREALSVALLAMVLVVAVVRPRRLPEAAVALPAAALLIWCGAIPWADAKAELSRLGPVVGFLVAVLVLADSCARDGLFRAVGGLLARWSRASGQRLLVGVFAAAAATTAVLSLDTTVVLLTPVIAATASHARLPARPHLYASAHLANSASLLMPVSNLTNLLAVASAGLSFTRFTALMALPWLATLSVELGAFKWAFRRELSVEGHAVGESAPLPRFAVVVVALTLLGFVAASLAGVSPAWAATAGALAMAGKRVLCDRDTLASVWRSAAAPFCLFVLALGVVTRAVSDNGVGSLVDHLLPSGTSLPALLGIAGLAACASNLLNNLPATLLLVPIAAGGGAADTLAVLVGVNIGPNLTYVGSLATLLWRRGLAAEGHQLTLPEFTKLGLLTVPLTLAAATGALWLSIHAIGTR